MTHVNADKVTKKDCAITSKLFFFLNRHKIKSVQTHTLKVVTEYTTRVRVSTRSHVC